MKILSKPELPIPAICAFYDMKEEKPRPKVFKQNYDRYVLSIGMRKVEINSGFSHIIRINVIGIA